MASKHEVEAIFKLKDEMSVQLVAIQKRAAALEKEAKGLIGTTAKTQSVFGEFSKGLEKFSPRMGAAASQVSSLTSGLSPLAVGLGVAGAGIVAVGGFAVSATKTLVEMGDRLTNLSRVTGISTDALQRLEAFGRPIGISLEQMTSASTKLEKALGEGGKGVTEALKKLGLSMDDLAGMDADVRLRAVAEAISRLNSPLDQAAAGSALLGRAWADLRLDAKSIEEGNAALEGLVVVSNEALDAGEALGDSWEKLWVNLKNTAVENSSSIAKALNFIVEAADSALESFNETNARMAREGAVTAEARRLAGGFFAPAGSTEALRAQAEKNVAALEKVRAFQAKADAERIENLKKIQAGQRELTDEEKKELEKFEKLRKKAAEEEFKSIVRLSEAHAKAAGDAWQFWGAAYDKIEKARMDADIASATEGFGPLGFSGGTGLSAGGRFTGMHLGSMTPGVDFSSFGKAAEEADDLSLSLASAADIAQVFGDQLGGFGEALIQGAASADLLNTALDDIKEKSLGLGNAMALATGAIAGGLAIANATSSGSSGSRAGRGALAGAAAGAAFGPIGMGVGAAAGAIVGWLRGRGPAAIGRDAGRDIGVELSQGLMEQIHKSGDPIQTFLTEIFAEGGLGIDRFAEEVGDLFSMFDRSEIGKDTLIAELKEDLPILIAHFAELGESGQAQIQRILGAAEGLGLEMQEIRDLVQAGFAPDTMEEIAKTFDITNDQVREIAAGLGIDIQTDLERMAATLGLSVEEMNALGAAVQEKFKIPIDQIDELLASLGVSASAFAGSLGVSLAQPTGGLQPGMDPEAFGAGAGKVINDFNRDVFNGFGDKLDRLPAAIEAAIFRAVKDAQAFQTQ